MAGQRSVDRRTQPERSAATRAALLDATIECLVRHGYAGTIAARVCAEAGVSRGALAHHFGTMEALMVRAVEHLALRRATEIREQFSVLTDDGQDGVERALDALWGGFSGPLFQAVLELCTAARSNPVLRESLEPVERGIERGILAISTEVFPPEVARSEGFVERITIALWVMRGLATYRTFQTSEEPVQAGWRAARPWLGVILRRTTVTGRREA